MDGVTRRGFCLPRLYDLFHRPCDLPDLGDGTLARPRPDRVTLRPTPVTGPGTVRVDVQERYGVEWGEEVSLNPGPSKPDRRPSPTDLVGGTTDVEVTE